MQLEDGYLVILPRDQAKLFFGKRDDQERLQFLNEWLASGASSKYGCEGQWQALHEVFSNVNIENSFLTQCILGGRPMHQGDDYHVCLVRPDVVRFIADQGEQIDATQIEAAIFEQVRAVLGFYRAAAELTGAVVFVAKTT